MGCDRAAGLGRLHLIFAHLLNQSGALERKHAGSIGDDAAGNGQRLFDIAALDFGEDRRKLWEGSQRELEASLGRRIIGALGGLPLLRRSKHLTEQRLPAYLSSCGSSRMLYCKNGRWPPLLSRHKRFRSTHRGAAEPAFI